MSNNTTANGTLSKLQPLSTVETYEVSTQQAAAHLQSLIDAMADVQRKKSDKAVPNVELTLVTLKASDKYYPFVAIMGVNALADTRRGGDGEELSIFDLTAEDGSRRLLPHVWGAVSPFLYVKQDKDMFRSSSGRAQLKISSGVAEYLTTICSPRLERRGGQEYVIFLIDPLRIFSSMVDDGAGSGMNFIEVQGVVQNAGTDYVYKFDKVPAKKKKRRGDVQKDIERALYAAMRNGGRPQ